MTCPSIGRVTAQRRRGNWLDLRFGTQASMLLKSIGDHWILGSLPGARIVLTSVVGNEGKWLTATPGKTNLTHLLEFQGPAVKAIGLPKGPAVDLWCNGITTMDGRLVVTMDFTNPPTPRRWYNHMWTD